MNVKTIGSKLWILFVIMVVTLSAAVVVLSFTPLMRATNCGQSFQVSEKDQKKLSARADAGDPDAELTLISGNPDFSNSGQLDGIITERFAKKTDIDSCIAWTPDSTDLLLPLTIIIQRAKEAVERPISEHPYSLPELRGVDLRIIQSDLWYWEIFFAFSIDNSKISGLPIRDGGIINSVMILPNGGLIHVRKRKMNAKERIQYGVDIDPEAAAPFAPTDPFAPKLQGAAPKPLISD